MTDALKLSEYARAKVNLTLRVLGRRADGFHELDSLVAFADVGDRVTLATDLAPGVHITGPFAAAIEGENLAARALALLSRTEPELRFGLVVIDKHLPVAAGLGGGSANAAAVLRLIKRANPALSERVNWMAMAAHLGSDVPACFANHACRMTGRGETLGAVPNFAPLHAVLVNPHVPVPADKTRQVFRRLAAAPLAEVTPEGFAGSSTADGWMEHIRDGRNDLEAPATAVIPAIAGVLAVVRADRRTQLARLSGAGPTCFALTATSDDAQGLAADLAARHPVWWIRATQLA